MRHYTLFPSTVLLHFRDPGNDSFLWVDKDDELIWTPGGIRDAEGVQYGIVKDSRRGALYGTLKNWNTGQELRELVISSERPPMLKNLLVSDGHTSPIEVRDVFVFDKPLVCHKAKGVTRAG